MSINFSIKHENLIESTAEAILLTVDGAACGMEGNIARAFQRSYPEVWEELKSEIHYPITLGDSIALHIHESYDCPFRLIIVASTLNHLEILSDYQKVQVIETAFFRALSLCHQNQARSMVTAIMSGGWRLPLEEALTSMIAIIQRFYSLHKRSLRISFCILGEDDFARALVYLDEHKIDYQLGNSEVSIYLAC